MTSSLKSMFVVYIISLTVTSLVADKAGSCPALPAGTFGTCDNRCTGDASCEGTQKCCSNGCGRVCKEPVSAQPPPGCPSMMCRVGCGYIKDSRGCNVCECTCQSKICAATEECRMIQPPCTMMDPCVAMPQCFQKASNQTAPGSNCPVRNMACVYCPNGYKTDSNGCSTCECIPVADLCMTMKCPPNTQCRMMPPPPAMPCRPGSMCPAMPPPTAQCVPNASPCQTTMNCPPCPSGYVMDSNGCNTCQCANPANNTNPCMMMKCPVNTQCRVMPSTTIMCMHGGACPPAPQTAQCVPIDGTNDRTTCCNRMPLNALCMNLCSGDYIIQDIYSRMVQACSNFSCNITSCYMMGAICPQLMCPECAAGNTKDANGCRTCQCSDPCMTMPCPANAQCQLQQVQCFRAPCPPIAQCVPINNGTNCSQLMCPECAAGNTKDAKGCRTCQCSDPCMTMQCPANTQCQLQQVQCKMAPCPPIAQCVPINSVPNHCAVGTALTDSSGATVYCGRGGQRCPQTHECNTDPADRFAVCCPKASCPVLGCPDCQAGNVKDSRGCRTCMCSDQCQTTQCPANQECQLKQVQCITAPCLPLPTCVPVVTDPPPAKCVLPKKTGSCKAALTRWYYDTSSQTCMKFTYGGCGKNDNNFVSLQNCQSACRPVAPAPIGK